MSETPAQLAGAFDAVGYDDWARLAQAALKGAPIERHLLSKTDDGLEIAPIHARAEHAAQHTRKDPTGWSIVQRADHPNIHEANNLLLCDLSGGCDIVELTFAGGCGAHGNGINAETVSDLDTVLDEVLLDLVPFRIDAGQDTRHVAALLVALAERRKIDPAKLDLTLLIDPPGHGLQLGRMAHLNDVTLDRLLDFHQWLSGHGVTARIFSADSRLLHAAGASEAQELAYLISSGVYCMRALEKAGLSPRDASSLISFTLTADANQHLTIAKFRALRQLWAKIEAEAGVAPTPAAVHAVTGRRMFTQYDPYVNTLRATMATFAAAVGGADSILALPHTAELGLADMSARRLARNLQLILREESNLHRVADPAGGSGALETLTKDLCLSAWTRFQQIENAGGIMCALAAGTIQEDLAHMQEQRAEEVATRRRAITGISEYALLTEHKQRTASPVTDELQTTKHSLDLPKPGGGILFAALLKAAHEGAKLSDMSAARGSVQVDTCKPVKSRRLAEPFERLRDLSDSYLMQYGHRPSIFLANLGKRPDFAARAAWIRNLFEAGGIYVISSEGYDSPHLIAAAYQRSDAKLACLCSSDAVYAELGEMSAEALRSVGARHVYLAGLPKGQQEGLAQAGVGTFIYNGCNVLDVLNHVYASLHYPPDRADVPHTGGAHS